MSKKIKILIGFLILSCMVIGGLVYYVIDERTNREVDIYYFSFYVSEVECSVETEHYPIYEFNQESHEGWSSLSTGFTLDNRIFMRKPKFLKLKVTMAEQSQSNKFSDWYCEAKITHLQKRNGVVAETVDALMIHFDENGMPYIDYSGKMGLGVIQYPANKDANLEVIYKNKKLNQIDQVILTYPL